jgi:hypothetical protein
MAPRFWCADNGSKAMTSKAALFALLALWGVGAGSALPARADDAAPDSTPAEARTGPVVGPAGLVNRIWQRAEADGQPGVVRIFLSDGTLVMDDCWETHRLSNWSCSPDGLLHWREAGKDVHARVKALGLDRLVLVVDRKRRPVEEHYTAASARLPV